MNKSAILSAKTTGTLVLVNPSRTLTRGVKLNRTHCPHCDKKQCRETRHHLRGIKIRLVKIIFNPPNRSKNEIFLQYGHYQEQSSSRRRHERFLVEIVWFVGTSLLSFL